MDNDRSCHICGQDPPKHLCQSKIDAMVLEAKIRVLEEAAEIAGDAWNDDRAVVNQKEQAMRMKRVYLEKAADLKEIQSKGDPSCPKP